VLEAQDLDTREIDIGMPFSFSLLSVSITSRKKNKEGLLQSSPFLHHFLSRQRLFDPLSLSLSHFREIEIEMLGVSNLFA
jgi:hypothetical protein